MDSATRSMLDELEQDTTMDAAGAFLRLASHYFLATRDGSGPVSTALAPRELAARFDEPLPRDAQPLEQVVARLERDVLPDVNRLCHPRSLGHQVSAPLAAAVWTDAVVSAFNQSGAVWEMSPVGTVIEARVVRWMCDLAGFGPRAGGAFTSGGTEATFTALLAARAAALPDAWHAGVGANPPVLVCGEHAHYGVTRAAGELGIGTGNVVVVPARDYRMDVTALERTLDDLARNGRAVMAVVATAGTTATGTFDDLEAIGRLCADRAIWLHVDAAHGGSALLSGRERQRLAGCARAQSIAWDPHKMMLVPLSASVVLVSDEAALDRAFAQRAPYLFHAGEGERTWDQGVRTFQCSRRIDALKVWVALQRHGATRLGALYDHVCATARRLAALVRARHDFEALHEPESNILCFRYVGDGSLQPAALDALNQGLRERFNRSGEGWITTTVLGGRRVLRATVMNPRTAGRDLERVLDGLAALAERSSV